MGLFTSTTFPDFVLGTATEEESHSNILTLNPNSKSFTISAPGTFLDKEFVLDFEAVFNETLPAAPVSFTREKVLFADLKACVRSLAFGLSFDSVDLLNFVGRMEDVVYVSALNNVPVSQRNRATYSPALTPAPSILVPSVLVPSLRQSFQSPVTSIHTDNSTTDVTNRSEELRTITRGTEPSDNITSRNRVPPILAPFRPIVYRTTRSSDSRSISGNSTRSLEPTNDIIPGLGGLVIPRRPTKSTNNSTTPTRSPSPKRTLRADEPTNNDGVRSLGSTLSNKSTNNFMDPRPQNDEDQRHGG